MQRERYARTGAQQTTFDARVKPMPREVSNEELASALAAAQDEAGVDQRLASATASMSADERQRAEENIRRWMAAAQRSREGERAKSDV